MEENNKFQNLQNAEVNGNNVENSANQEQNNSEKKKGRNSKVLTVVLVVIVLILVLVLGIGGGLLISGKNINQIINKSSETVKSEEDKNSNVEKNESKKLDESKPWVYDADYHNDKQIKVANRRYAEKNYNSKDDIKIPYINVNSEYAKSLNKELSEEFEKIYNTYGPIKGTNNSNLIIVSYEYGITDNILSIMINRDDFGTYDSGRNTIKVYNINLNTLKAASLEDVYTECGFESRSELMQKANIAINNYMKQYQDNDIEWDGKQYFIDKNKSFNAVFKGPERIEHVIVKKDVKAIESTKTESKIETSTTNSNMADEYIKIIDKTVSENPNGNIKCDLIYFNNDDIPDLVIGNLGYWVSVYTYVDGKVYNPVDNWGYGAGGNSGYIYQERKGRIFNYDSDYAGSILNTSVYMLNSNEKFDILSKTEQGADVHDTNDSELIKEVENALKEYGGYYYNDNKITEEEFNNKVKELSVSFNDRDYKVLDGDKKPDEVKQKLK